MALDLETRSKAYLRIALELTPNERERRDGLIRLLPASIYDSHTHMANVTELLLPTPDDIASHPVDTFGVYTYEQALAFRNAFWKDVRVRSLRMAHAFRSFDHRAINRRLAVEAPASEDIFCAYGLPDDTEYTLRLLADSRTSALKMYYAYRSPPYTTISEIFPKSVLERAEARQIPIILHLPKPMHLTSAELEAIAGRHPGLPIVVAHLGGHGAHYYDDSMPGVWIRISNLDNVYFDTALMFDRRLIRSALETVGPSRLLYGTDEPLSLIRVVPYLHERLGPRYHAPVYHWAQDDRPPDAVRCATPQLLQLLQLEALVEALAPFGESARTAVFRDNFKRVFLADAE
jgi:hypothetical protein